MDTTASSSRRQLIVWLDDAIDEHDCGAPVDALAAVLRRMARETACDAAVSDRMMRVATRTADAVSQSDRDIASVLARDIRRDLMCGIALNQSRNHCAGDARDARRPVRFRSD